MMYETERSTCMTMYSVSAARYGIVLIEADSPQEAVKKAASLPHDIIAWANLIEFNGCKKVENDKS